MKSTWFILFFVNFFFCITNAFFTLNPVDSGPPNWLHGVIAVLNGYATIKCFRELSK